MPKLSFLGFVYNQEMYVANAIDSLLEQTEKDIEVIYVNDGSTDGTRDILDYYTKVDKRFKCLHLKENQGISKAWNQGLSLVTGPIVAVVSGDDIYFTKRAEIHIGLHSGDPGKFEVTYGSYLRGDSMLRPMEGKLRDGSDARKFVAEKYTKESLKHKQTIPHGFMSLTTSLARAVPMREDLKVGVDYPFLVDLERAGASFRHTVEVLGMYRFHAKMVSQTRRKEVDASTRAAGGSAEESYGASS